MLPTETESQSPVSLYVHVPFCKHRCGYCNFSISVGREHWIDRYLAALRIELRQRLAPFGIGDWKPETIYIGGGTPTRLSISQLQELNSIIRSSCDCDDVAEWTIESNPSDLSEERVMALESMGVNRLSIGIQSFRQQKLTSLDRDHTANEVVDSLELAKSRFRNVSIDLIFGAPDERRSHWQDDLNTAIDHDVSHLSTYGLTYEKGTRFWNRRLHGELSELPEDLFVEMYLMTIDRLVASGYEHYEISSFAKTGCQSRHNHSYWSGAPYEAIGSGASRFDGQIRQTNHASPLTYMKRVEAGESAVSDTDRLSTVDRAKELFVVGLRRIAGVNQSQFEKRVEQALNRLFPIRLQALLDDGYLEQAHDVIRLTRKGLLVSDAVFGQLLIDD